MAAQPMDTSPEDPAEILRVLPPEWHEQFLADYLQALDAAHDVWRFEQLRDLLHLWRLRAVAYSRPGYEDARQAAENVDRTSSYQPSK